MIRLSPNERWRLEEQLQRTADARQCRRVWGLLELADGQDAREVAEALDIDRRTLQRWQQVYELDRHPASLIDRPGRGRKPLLEPEDRSLVETLLSESPQALGYRATQWTVPLLRQHLCCCGLPSCSKSTLRRELHALGLVWKRPRYVLSPDPEKEKKTRHRQQAQPRWTAKHRSFRG